MAKTRSKRKIINKNRKKKKSLKYRGGASAAAAPAAVPAMSPEVACCKGGIRQIKFVRVHGCSTRGIINARTGKEYDPIIEIPPKTNVITLTEPGDILSVPSSIKDVIFRSYKQGNTLYPNMHREPNKLTDSGQFIEDTFNNMNRPQTLKAGEEPKPKIKFKNHLSGKHINNIFMDFNDPTFGSDEQIETSCKIFCLNKIGPYKHAVAHNHSDPTSQGCSPEYQINSMTPAAGRHRAHPANAQERYYEGDLKGLLQIEGPGTYILSICRGYEGNDAKDVIDKMKAFSAGET